MKRKPKTPTALTPSRPVTPAPATPSTGSGNTMAGGRAQSAAPSSTLALPDMSILATSDGGRFAQFPQFGQIGRTGLLSQNGSFMPGTQGGASRVFNPDTISLAEYDEMGLYPVIRSCLLGYALVMQTADLSVSCADSSMKALIEAVLLPKLPQLMRETVMPAQTFGWASAETVWETLYNVPVDMAPTTNDPAAALAAQGMDPGDQAQRVFPYVTAIKDFIPLANNTLTLRQTGQGQFAGAVQWAWGQSFLPPSKLFHFPLGGMFRNPYGQAPTKSLYPFWVWARFLWEMCMVAVERGASPPLIGRYPAGLRIAAGVDSAGRPLQQDAGDFLLSQLTQLRSFATAVFPRQLDPNGNDLYDVKELPLDAHVDWMSQVIEMCHKQMMLGLFWPDKLLASGDVGSYALAKEHTDLFSLAIRSRLDEFLWHINEGPVKQFVKFNDRKCPAATITYSAPNIEAMQSLAMSVIQAMTSGQCLVGPNQDQILVPDWQGLADDLGIPYDLVRKTDGLDAYGRPLVPGQDPNAQDAVPPGQDPAGGAPDASSGAQGSAGNQGGDAAPSAAVSDDGGAAQREQDTQALLADIPEDGVVLRDDDLPEMQPFSIKPLLPSSANTLSAMVGKPSVGMDEIAAAHGGDPATVLHKVQTMAGKNYIHPVSAAAEGVPSSYALTPQGKATLDQHNALKTHLLGQLHSAGPLDYTHLAKSAQASFHPKVNISGAIQHLEADNHVTQTDHVNASYALTPQGQSEAAKKAPVVPEMPKPAEAGAVGAGEPAGLSPGQQAVYEHIKANPGASLNSAMEAHHAATGTSTGAMDALYGMKSAGHLETHANGYGYQVKGEPGAAPAAAPSPGHVTLGATKYPLSGGEADQPSTAETVAALTKGQNAHPDVKTKLQALADVGLTQGKMAATVAMASAVKNQDGHNKLLAKHFNAVTPYGSDLAQFKAEHPDAASHLGDHEVPGQAAPAAAGITTPAAAAPGQETPAASAEALDADHAQVLKMAKAVQANRTPLPAKQIIDAGLSDNAEGKSGFLKAWEKNHLEGDLHNGFHLTPDGQKALDAHENAQTNAPNADAPKTEGTPADALPSGWKPISTKADKGYKISTNSHTAYVKPTKDGKWQVAATDGRDVDIHPETFDTKEAGFEAANKQIGRKVPEEPAPAEAASEEAEPTQSQDAANEYGHVLPIGWSQEHDSDGAQSTSAGQPIYSKADPSDPENTAASATGSYGPEGGFNGNKFNSDGSMNSKNFPTHQEAIDWAEAEHRKGMQSDAEAQGTGDAESSLPPGFSENEKTVYQHYKDNPGHTFPQMVSANNDHDFEALSDAHDTLDEAGHLQGVANPGQAHGWSVSSKAAEDKGAEDKGSEDADPFPDNALKVGAEPEPPASPSADHADLATPEDYQSLIKGQSLHPDSKAKLTAAMQADPFMTKDALGKIVDHASSLKSAAGSVKINPSHMAAALKAHEDGTLGQLPDAPADAPAPKPAAAAKPAATPSAAPAPAPEGQYVTVPKNGQMVKTPLSSAPLKPSDTSTAKETYGLTPKAETSLKAAIASGKIKTQGDLAQTLAMTHAINKGSSYQHLTGFSLDKALGHGTVAKMKAAAEADPTSEAATHAAALEDTNILSPKAQSAADADAAFKGMSGEDLMHTKVGAQAGSNPGGFYKTSKGDDVYAKTYKDDQQAHSEHAANQIYNALGLSAPSSTVAKTKDGKTVYASKLIPNAGTLGSQGVTKAHAQKALKGHAADILLGNHDVAGMGLDNMVTGEGGKVSRIDNGGALLYRAQGTKKTDAETGSLGAWDGMSDPAKNADYAKLFQKAGYKDASSIPGITSQIADIQKLEAKHGGWDNYLKQAAPDMDASTRQQTATMLTKRTQLLGAKKLELMDKQGGSLDALAGKTSVSGGTSKSSGNWGDTPFAQYAKKVDGLGYGAATKNHFDKLYEGHSHVFSDLTSPISKWTGSSNGHAWHEQWPAALDGKTHAGAMKVAEAYATRRDRWQKISDEHGVPFPETFHIHRGTADKDGTVLPHIISAWRNEAEPYMMAKAHPAASWSLSKDAAKGFYGGTNGAMYETHVPFAQTLADKFADDQSFLHSFPHEHEVVVGGRKDSVIVPKSGVTAKYKTKEYTYADREKLFDEWKKDHGGQLPDPKHFGIDIAEHQNKVGQKVQLKENVREENVTPEEKTKYSDYIKKANAEIKAFQAPLIEAGVTPAPPDGTVPPLGSFAEARAEQADADKNPEKDQ